MQKKKNCFFFGGGLAVGGWVSPGRDGLPVFFFFSFFLDGTLKQRGPGSRPPCLETAASSATADAKLLFLRTGVLFVFSLPPPSLSPFLKQKHHQRSLLSALLLLLSGSFPEEEAPPEVFCLVSASFSVSFPTEEAPPRKSFVGLCLSFSVWLFS